jgi:maltooligosyltrehalose trehalohydrolase
MKRIHRMPFGAQPLPGGGVRFRLWAPGARALQLCIEGPGTAEIVPMNAAGNGWFELESAQAQRGTRYRYLLENGVRVPDPASRANPDDVHGPSLVVDPLAFEWEDGDWRGRPWEETVTYELHVGTFSPAGTFAGVEQRLDYLLDLGITALELMPVADFPGERNWGYDGVLLFAPDARYGTPEDLKRLVQSAHRRGLMVFLDVVYNHFGPDGNYLGLYAPQFFTERHRTPWGAAINFDGADSRPVRDFYVHNALYWLEEYHLDGLRFDAVHAIADESQPHILNEISQAVRAAAGANRHAHLVLENDDNAARYLGDRPGAPGRYDAQWNDDFHHALHVLLTGETDGYYEDYARQPVHMLGRALAEGFAYQGEPSPHRGGRRRGESSGHFRPTAFVPFLQNHDQVGNRAFGDRLSAETDPVRLEAAVAILLLSPQAPLLFMGEEWAARTPFPFFCDFEGELAAKVTEGRRHEFARFERFRDERARLSIPDPEAPATFESARLDWAEPDRPGHLQWLQLYRSLLRLRAREIAPRLPGMRSGARFEASTAGLLRVEWTLGDGARLHLLANLGMQPQQGVGVPPGRLLFCNRSQPALGNAAFAPWSVAWLLEPHDA